MQSKLLYEIKNLCTFLNQTTVGSTSLFSQLFVSRLGRF